MKTSNSISLFFLFKKDKSPNSLRFGQKVKLLVAIDSLSGVIKVLKKVQVRMNNPLDVNRHLFDIITSLEKTHKKLIAFLT